MDMISFERTKGMKGLGTSTLSPAAPADGSIFVFYGFVIHFSYVVTMPCFVQETEIRIMAS